MGLERINLLRKEQGLTIEELSAKADVPLSTLKKICAGSTTNPALETVKSIARALNCTIDEFDDTKKAPAMQEPGSLSLEGSNSLLAALGLVEDGYELSDDDLAFLTNVLGLLNNWFRRNQP